MNLPTDHATQALFDTVNRSCAGHAPEVVLSALLAALGWTVVQSSPSKQEAESVVLLLTSKLLENIQTDWGNLKQVAGDTKGIH